MSQFPNTGSADGIWSLNEIRDARRGLNWPGMEINVEYLVVAGGGGGASVVSGGGGGG